MREQLLAANHFLMGTTNLLVIEVPDAWMVMDGTTGPEVEQWVAVGDVRWMSAGQAQYRLIQPHPDRSQLARTQVDLRIWATPAGGSPPTGSTVVGEQSAGLLLGGHTATRAFGTVKRGLLPRRDVPALHVAVSCPETGRHLRLEFAAGYRDGRPLADAADLHALLNGLVCGFRCH